MKNIQLKLTPKALRELAEEFEISNLLNPSEDDVKKIAHLDFITRACFKGTRHLGEKAPTEEQIEEEYDFKEMFKAVTSALGND